MAANTNTLRPFEMTPAMRRGTRMLVALLKLGVPMGPLRLLAHRGRKTGTVYRTPVALVVDGDEMWLVAAFGEVNWVHNVRAAGEVRFKQGWRGKTYRIEELSHAAAAPVLRTFRRRFGLVPFIRPYFDATGSSSDAAFRREAERHPVFRLSPKV